MASREGGFLPRGSTYGATAITDGDEYEGMEVEFISQDFLPSERIVKARLVRNESGGTLTPGATVKANYANGRAGTQCGAACSALDVPMGVVDPKLTANVANHDLFWLIYEGPTQVIAKTGATIAAGDTIVTDASGTLATIASVPASATAAQQDALAVVGKAITGVTTASAGAKIWANLKQLGT